MFTLILAGDTHKSYYNDDDFPSSDWLLTYYLNGPVARSFVAVDAGDNIKHALTLTAEQTAVLKPGTYSYTVRMTADDESFTVQTGTVTVAPNPALTPAKVATAERMIELIDKALLNQLSEGEAYEALSISGRSISTINRLELIEERQIWRNELNALQSASSGASPIRSIRIQVGRL